MVARSRYPLPMGTHADLRVGSEVRRVDLGELEEDIRRARVLADAELHHPPWTGDHWQRIDQIAPLAHALDTPDARLAAHLLRPGRAWLVAALTLGFMLAAAAQLASGARLTGNPALVHRLSVGWESTLVDGAWWSAWTAPLLHQNFAHLLGNLVILAYCGWRCERAVGATGLACILAGASTGAALGVLVGAEHGAVGASGLAFGVWGGQFAIGWRYGTTIPAPLRAYYGAGTLWVALVLLAWTSLSPTVTFAAHLGGFAGGCIAVLCLPVATAVHPARRTAARRSALLLGAAFAAIVPALSAVAPHLPALLLQPSTRVTDPHSGLTVSLPWRLRPARRAPSGDLAAAPGAPVLTLACLTVEADTPRPRELVAIHGTDALMVTWDPNAPIEPGRKALYEAIAASAGWEAPAWLRPPGVVTAAAAER